MNAYLTDEEVNLLIQSAISQGSASKDEIDFILDWAATVRTDYAMLKLVMEGRLRIGWDDDEDCPRFVDPGQKEVVDIGDALGWRR